MYLYMVAKRVWCKPNYIKERFKVIEGVDISIVEEYDLPMNLEQKRKWNTKQRLGFQIWRFFGLAQEVKHLIQVMGMYGFHQSFLAMEMNF